MRSPLVRSWLALAVCGSALAEEPPVAPPPPRLAIHGFVDIYYGLNFNRPADGASFAPGSGTTGKRAEELSLNIASVALSYAPAPFGVELQLIYGTGAEVLHAAEPARTATGADVWRFVGRASILYHQGDVTVEAGIYPSHVGYETAWSKDNWLYTRGWLGENSPYYQTGIKVAYAFTPNLSAQLHVVNGWQLIGDNNEAKTIGTAIIWTSDAVTLSFNTLIGPETPGDNRHWRFYGDAIAAVQVTPAFGLAAELDAGVQQRAVGDATGWQGVGLFARYALSDAVALAARGEIYHDPDGTITGVGETAGEASLAVEVKPADGVSLKLEGRYDRSDAPVFATHDADAAGKPIPTTDEWLVIAGAVASF
ncbi:MAG TPA: porin [Haliangiales bacterium]|nr:porin [Haliangiales bacterium]